MKAGKVTTDVARSDSGLKRLGLAGVCLVLPCLQIISGFANAQTGAKQETAAQEAATQGAAVQGASVQGAAKPDAAKQTVADPAKSLDVTTGEIGRTPTIAPSVILPLTLNFQMWNNSVVVVDVLLNGKLYKGILDTGLSGCAITPAEAATLKLETLPSRVTVATLNETRLVPEATLKNLQFNAVKIGALRVGLLDVSELYAGVPQPDAPPLWLGTPFLQAFQITIDYPNKAISLNRPNAPLPKDKGAVTLPLELRDGHLYTRVEVPGIGRFSALVDTGTLGTVVPASIGRRIKGAPAKTFAVKGANGKMLQASLITLPKIKVGTLEQAQVPALYLTAEMPDKPPTNDKAATNVKPGAGGKPVVDEKSGTSGKPKTNDRPNAVGKSNEDSGLAVLGNDFLHYYKVTINIARHKMTLTPPVDPNDPDADATKKTPPTQTRQQQPLNTGVKRGRQ